jgi:crossover junction endodeoxyribonuclease RuvC
VTLPLDIETPGTPPPGKAGTAGALDTMEPDAGKSTTAASVPAGPVLNVIGIDLSLRRTGIATAQQVRTLSPPAQLTGFARLRWIRAQILGMALTADHVVIEGLSYGSHTPSALERAGLWHLVMVAIDARGIAWTQIAPATLKKYATGKGNADKGQVLAAAIHRLPVAIDNDNTADAAWLAAIGHDLLGHPITDLPAAQRAAIDKHRKDI